MSGSCVDIDAASTFSVERMDWSIQDIARLAGTTSRTLRHYGDIGLLEPSRVGGNGYRYYDERALTRLQRILLLRDLGLGLPAIAEILDGQQDDTAALRGHLAWLHQEQHRLDRQIASVELTIEKLEGGEQLMAEDMFTGFDHTQYKSEVEERWGADAYAKGDAWWTSKGAAEKAQWQADLASLHADWADAANRGISPSGDEARALVERQVAWLNGIPGTPRSSAYYVGLGEMYVADERFAKNYGGIAGATFVRDALTAYYA
jgi:MerR family transcriptional regulator, thiopeptide resistance regulator